MINDESVFQSKPAREEESSQHLPTISKDITKLGDFASGSHQATSPFIANHEHTVNRGSGAAATPLQSNRREGSKNKPIEATYQVREISSQSDKKRGFDPEPVSKRTLTEEAYDDAKIREDEKLH